LVHYLLESAASVLLRQLIGLARLNVPLRGGNGRPTIRGQFGHRFPEQSNDS